MSNNENKKIKIFIFWLTDKRNNLEYKSFVKLANNFSDCDPKIFTSISIIINYIKKIEFINTYIIITESEPMNTNFFSEFLKERKNIYVIPKFIKYTREKNNENNDRNNSYYNYGGKKSSLKKTKKFLIMKFPVLVIL